MAKGLIWPRPPHLAARREWGLAGLGCSGTLCNERAHVPARLGVLGPFRGFVQRKGGERAHLAQTPPSRGKVSEGLCALERWRKGSFGPDLGPFRGFVQRKDAGAVRDEIWAVQGQTRHLAAICGLAPFRNGKVAKGLIWPRPPISRRDWGSEALCNGKVAKGLIWPRPPISRRDCSRRERAHLAQTPHLAARLGVWRLCATERWRKGRGFVQRKGGERAHLKVGALQGLCARRDWGSGAVLAARLPFRGCATERWRKGSFGPDPPHLAARLGVSIVRGFAQRKGGERAHLAPPSHGEIGGLALCNGKVAKGLIGPAVQARGDLGSGAVQGLRICKATTRLKFPSGPPRQNIQELCRANAGAVHGADTGTGTQKSGSRICSSLEAQLGHQQFMTDRISLGECTPRVGECGDLVQLQHTQKCHQKGRFQEAYGQRCMPT